jgi:hypothetical protein
VQASDGNCPFCPPPLTLFELALHSSHCQLPPPGGTGDPASASAPEATVARKALAAHGAPPSRCVLVDTLRRPVPDGEAPPAVLVMPAATEAQPGAAAAPEPRETVDNELSHMEQVLQHPEFHLRALARLLAHKGRHQKGKKAPSQAQPLLGRALEHRWSEVRFASRPPALCCACLALGPNAHPSMRGTGVALYR